MRRAVGRDNRDGGGPSLASGEMYSYSLRRVKQGMDPGDALASSRALSNLAAAGVVARQVAADAVRELALARGALL